MKYHALMCLPGHPFLLLVKMVNYSNVHSLLFVCIFILTACLLELLRHHELITKKHYVTTQLFYHGQPMASHYNINMSSKTSGHATPENQAEFQLCVSVIGLYNYGF